ncbi:arylamine N-acetyltransferase [Yinghuangia aomiensis]
MDPAASVARIVAGRGGYCFHLNGAFAELLKALGFPVTRHRAGRPAPLRGPAGRARQPHGPDRALREPRVARRRRPRRRLPRAAAAAHRRLRARPLLLRPRPLRRRPRRLALHPRPPGLVPADGLRPEPVDVAEFEEKHQWLSTSPESSHLRTCAVLRRDAKGTDNLTGCVLKRQDAAGTTTTTVTTEADWYAVLADVFGLDLGSLGPEARRRLWDKVSAQHRAWEDTRAST